jgi:GST-like protein
MYTLFGIQDSGSAAVECALEIVGAPYRLVEAATWAPGSELEELAKVNPLRQIPTLVLPGGQVLSESAAILMHLGFAFPESRLLGDGPLARDLTLRGLVYIAANCYACISVVDYPERYTTESDDRTRAAIRAGATARLHHHWDVFADLYPVAGHGFLNGDRPGALDILAATVSHWSGAREHVGVTRPTFAALLARVDTHATIAPVFARHWGARPVASHAAR